MSRRTKFIILGLFLVLLAIPTAYVALTWRPADPLRFQLVDQRMERRNPFLEGYEKGMEVEVRNTSGASVYFGGGTIRASSTLGGANTDIGTCSEASELLHPRATVRVTFWVEDKTDISSETLKDSRIDYLLLSRPKAYAINAREWMRRKLPSRWSSRLFPPVLRVEDILDSDTTPLELAPGLIPGKFRAPEPEPEFPSPPPPPSDSH